MYQFKHDNNATITHISYNFNLLVVYSVCHILNIYLCTHTNNIINTLLRQGCFPRWTTSLCATCVCFIAYRRLVDFDLFEFRCENNRNVHAHYWLFKKETTKRQIASTRTTKTLYIRLLESCARRRRRQAFQSDIKIHSCFTWKHNA